MSQKLVTIATFDQAAKARLAQNALTEAGIRAAVADETVIAMDWLLGNAVGWIKVQVMDDDAERAVDILNEAFGEDGKGFGEKVDPAQPAAEAEAATPEDEEEPSEADFEKTLATVPSRTSPPSLESDQHDPTSVRDEDARRVVFIAWIGLALPPVAFYAVYVFLKAAFGEGTLSPRGRFNLLIGGATTLTSIAWAYLFVQFFMMK